ncbi:MAG: DUF4159 domain-containing protein [Planctomycetia bacterium]|nr:DUF4159 domain-containing protein [Planctomycetia bacterium]
MFRFTLVLFLLPLGLTALIPAAPRWGMPFRQASDNAGAGDDALVEKTRKAIDDAVAYLRSQQRVTDGGWDVGTGVNNGGWTALALLSLLNAGVPPDDPAIRRGVVYLKKGSSTRVYVIALRLMVFAQAARDDQEAMRADVKYLEECLLPDGWSYHKLVDGAQTGNADNSNTQYALLGLHEALMAGVPVSEKTLKTVKQLFLKSQTRDGGWGYRPGGRGATLTMTTAGLCNLVITGEDLVRGRARLRPDGSAEDCGKYEENEPVARGLAWLGEQFPAVLTDVNATDRLGSPFYALYGLERAGRLTGQRFFGGHDWYEVGTRYLVKTQKADGSWSGLSGRGALDYQPVVATSFALLFLSKGRTPVLVTKMAYGDLDGTGWNNKRSDMKHLSEFCSKTLFKGKPVAWQAFDIRAVEAAGGESRRQLAAQLLQSPLVFFNGHDLAPRNKEAEVMREYVTNGGFVLAENCCGATRYPNFEKDLTRLVRELFNGEAKLEPLEPEHPLWTASGTFASSPKDFPLQGVKLGCKTVMVYSPVPLAGYWETNDLKDPTAKKAFELGANLVAYATGLEAPRPRLSRVEITSDGAKEPIKRGYLQVAQLRHDGEWQPAPKAMRNLMVEVRKSGLDVILKTEPLFPSDPAVSDHRFLYMHGRNEFAAKREDLKHLRFCLRSGGMLFADACCGADKFDISFRKLVDELFGDERLALEPVPPDDPLFGKALNGEVISTVRRRPAKGSGKRDFESVAPKLEGVKYRGRWVVLYSRFDIGCALEKYTSPECRGHDQDSAIRLGRAAVLYALTR